MLLERQETIKILTDAREEFLKVSQANQTSAIFSKQVINEIFLSVYQDLDVLHRDSVIKKAKLP